MLCSHPCHKQDSTYVLHKCNKNYKGTSKGMEPKGFIDLCINSFEEKSFIVDIVVIDGDSSIRAKAKHMLKDLLPPEDDPTRAEFLKKRGLTERKLKTAIRDDTAMMPIHVPCPSKFKTDLNHYIRQWMKPIFAMSRTKGDGCNPTPWFAKKSSRYSDMRVVQIARME